MQVTNKIIEKVDKIAKFHKIQYFEHLTLPLVGLLQVKKHFCVFLKQKYLNKQPEQLKEYSQPNSTASE